MFGNREAGKKIKLLKSFILFSKKFKKISILSSIKAADTELVGHKELYDLKSWSIQKAPCKEWYSASPFPPYLLILSDVSVLRSYTSYQEV